jgi:hypothetical protein
MARYSADDILDYFDRLAEADDFPWLNDDIVYTMGAVRLTAYRDEKRWAVLIEVLCFWWGSLENLAIETVIFRLGNCVELPVMSDDAVGGLTCLDEDDQPCPFRADTSEPWRGATALIRGQRVPIPRDASAYHKKGITRDRKQYELDGSTDILWIMLPEHRESMLATEDELRRHVPADLPFFLRLDEWHHPDVFGGEMPSENDTFRSLAQALAHGDPNRFRMKRKPNTHWKNWTKIADG